VNMASPRSCVNNGGPSSLIRLGRVPRLEDETGLTGENLSALAHWQARVGEVLTVIDPEGAAYRARILCLEQQHAACVPFQRLATPVESPLRIEVYQALPDKERFELVLQKLTELGVARIIPMETQHSATLVERDAQQKKSHRWPDVICRASRQCRRAMLPELMPVHKYADALSAASHTELKLILYEGDTHWSFTEGIGSFRPQSVSLLVGPEGGFSRDEIEQAQTFGVMPVKLGPRILRTETAAIVAAALLQSTLGDLN
jgi:16S rRNA (uracil1498-N3)-methyltransferase